MTWQRYHTASQQAAVRAHELLRRNDPLAEAAFLEAAELEREALSFLSNDKLRTIGITAVSAASLYYKASFFDQAAALAHATLLRPELPVFAKHELRSILQSLWNEEAQREAGRLFAGSQILVSVRGGEVLTGGAPLDILLSKVQGIQSFVVRVAEFLANAPLRLKGPPTQRIADAFRPWLFQSPPGSYQFSIAIETPQQADLFAISDVSGAHVTDKFLNIMRSVCETPEVALADEVGDEGYRRTFLKLARNLAPSGKTIEEITLSGARSEHPVLLSSQSRKALGTVLRSTEPDTAQADEDVVVRGVLRALDLNRDWVEIDESGKPIRVYGMADTVDDVIGPMVNQKVTVRARKGGRQRLSFLDIELDE